MLIPTTVIGFGLAQIFSLVWGWIEGSVFESRAAKYGMAALHDGEFRMSWRAYTWPILGLSVSVWAWFGALSSKAPNLIHALAALFGAIALFVIYSNFRIRVVVRDGKVSYIEGNKTRWISRLTDITEVRVTASSRSSPMVQIFTKGNKKYHGLDIGFQRISLLLATLRRYRPTVGKREHIQTLIEQLEALVEILRLDPSCQWRAHFESGLDEAKTLSEGDFDQESLNKLSTSLTSVYGGMGSFNDYGPVIFNNESGRAKTIAGTEEFDKISKCVFEEALALRGI